MDLMAAFGLIIGAATVAGLARRVRIPPPILLVLVGLGVSYIPGVPDYTLNPEIVLALFLPPLLYSAAWSSSSRGFRLNKRPILLMSVGYTLFSTVVVAVTAWALIPGMPLAAAFALGAIVAPPDAVAATAVGRELGMQRRYLQVLQGESLVNDATALTAYKAAVAAAAGGITLLEGGGIFLLAAGGGVVLGGVLGYLLRLLRRHIHTPVLENALNLVVPFLVYLAAESVGASGVLAVVITGLYLGNTATETTPAARLQAGATWEVIDFLLESVVFALIGLQLPAVIDELQGRDVGTVVWWSVAVLVVTILGRFVWVFSTSYLIRALSPAVRARTPSPYWPTPTVSSWAGMRGVVSLAAAFALVADFPERGLILWLTFVVVFGTLVLQGLTLPGLIRRLGVGGQDDMNDRLAEANAQHQAARAATERLDDLVSSAPHPPPAEVVGLLRHYSDYRANSAWERLGGGLSHGGKETPGAAFRRLRQEMLQAQRDTFTKLRNGGELDDEVMREMVRELDLEETMLGRHGDDPSPSFPVSRPAAESSSDGASTV
ncbi:Na+/H+ antiporter [Cryptosporangium phraense]|uniref:Na+/H+ antiporter n=1 Tax=Cryptosporangium phraense TaxID=2593070 RepID=A0A545AKL7_9ACTN|nr:Na+/H+ antiporter [Cryptosporangium phraense]